MFKLCTKLSCVLYMVSHLFSFYKVGICVNLELKIDRMGAFILCIEQELKEGGRTEGRQECLPLATNLLLISFPSSRDKAISLVFSTHLFISPSKLCCAAIKIHSEISWLHTVIHDPRLMAVPPTRPVPSGLL